MPEPQRCDTCASWAPPKPGDHRGYCQAIDTYDPARERDDDEPAVVMVAPYEEAFGLYTVAEFGCMLWEAKGPA